MGKAKLLLIVADKVIETGLMSFIFIHLAKAPAEFRHGDNYGTLLLKNNDESHVDIFRVTKQPGDETPASTKHYEIHLRNSHITHELLSGGVEEAGLEELMLDILELSPSILLVEKHTVEHIKQVCAQLDIDVIEHHFSGDLPTHTMRVAA